MNFRQELLGFAETMKILGAVRNSGPLFSFPGGRVRADLISVVIVNYNGAKYLPDCLQALRRQSLPAYRYEVIVVDNHSQDASVELLRKEFPWVRVLALSENKGFAGGNNHALPLAHGSYLALLNNDTVVDPYWLETLLEEMERDPQLGGAVSKLIFHSDVNCLNSAGLMLLRDGHGQDRGFRETDEGQYEQPMDVFGGCGAAVLLRRRMLEEVGFFDERFFMYYEDLDLAWRARHAGWNFRYIPASVVRHVHCGSSGEWSPFFTFHVERNRVLTNLKNGDILLAGWTMFSLFSRLRKALVDWLRQRAKRDQHAPRVRAYVQAIGSLLRLVPAMMFERYRIRWQRWTEG